MRTIKNLIDAGRICVFTLFAINVFKKVKTYQYKSKVRVSDCLIHHSAEIAYVQQTELSVPKATSKRTVTISKLYQLY